VPIENSKHPLRVVVPSSLHGRVYHAERTVHFNGFRSGWVYVVKVGPTKLSIEGGEMSHKDVFVLQQLYNNIPIAQFYRLSVVTSSQWSIPELEHERLDCPETLTTNVFDLFVLPTRLSYLFYVLLCGESTVSPDSGIVFLRQVH
jgi:hypothetical protein